MLECHTPPCVSPRPGPSVGWEAASLDKESPSRSCVISMRVSMSRAFISAKCSLNDAPEELGGTIDADALDPEGEPNHGSPSRTQGSSTEIVVTGIDSSAKSAGKFRGPREQNHWQERTLSPQAGSGNRLETRKNRRTPSHPRPPNLAWSSPRHPARSRRPRARGHRSRAPAILPRDPLTNRLPLAHGSAQTSWRPSLP